MSNPPPFGCVSIQSLPSWADELESGPEAEPDQPILNLKFSCAPQLNKKVILCQGDIRTIDAVAIVNSTNESMTEYGLSGQILDAAGPELKLELYHLEPCRTGEARLTGAYRLPSSYIIHTVGPRYHDKYKTAAENALHNCYRSCLALAREQSIPTVAIPIINSVKKGYPPEGGAHIAIRTVRRFLEHWGDSFTSVVFVLANQNDYDLYKRLLALYFPRNRNEEMLSKNELPRDVGNEFGETVIEERKIRIQAHPGSAADPPTEALATVKLDQSFAAMRGNFDDERMLRLGSQLEKDREAIIQHRLYNSWLDTAKNEDLSDVAALNCVYLGDRLFLYMIRLLDPVVSRPYVVVYMHSGMSSKDMPDWDWVKKVYNVLDYRYGENLGAFLVLHPTFWLKLAETIVSPFTSNSVLFRKLRYVKGLSELFAVIDRSQLRTPDEVFKYDLEENGPLPAHSGATNAASLSDDL